MTWHCLSAVALALLGQRALARLQAASDCLIVVFDDLGAADAALMPNLQAFAAQGVRFDRAYSSSPTCSPSRLAMLAGIYARREGIGDLSLNPLTISGPVQDRLRLTLTWLPEVLQAHGYETGLFGKDHLGRAPITPGDDLGLQAFQLARIQAPLGPFTRGFTASRAVSPCVPVCGF